MGNFRPISVLNTSVKIIAKGLANHLRNILGDIIDDHQTRFLREGSILDSIAPVQKVIQFTKRYKIPGSC